VAGRQVVVVDVLRATTTMIAALAAGATAIVPVAEVVTARALAVIWPEAVLGGEREGVAPPGFQLGNSPTEYTPAVVAGRTVILCTTNGTRALAGLAAARRVYIGAARNAAALVERLAAEAADVTLIAAGRDEGHRVGLDDCFVLGLIAARLAARGARLDDSAQICVAVYEHFGGDALAAFQASGHGRLLRALGFAADLVYCAAVDQDTLLPVVDYGVAGPPRVRLDPTVVA
jgi:2-phosphosulfolactate phosphatase